jgi:hypothetical protein
MNNGQPEGRDPDAIAAEIQEGEWLDVPPASEAPPEGDLPDDVVARTHEPSLPSRIRRAFSRG